MQHFDYANNKFLKINNDPLFFIYDVAKDKPKINLDFVKFDKVKMEIVEPLINPPIAQKALFPSFYARNIKPLMDTLCSALFYLVERIYNLFHTIFCCCAVQVEVEEKQLDIKEPLPQLLPAPKPIVVDPVNIPKKQAEQWIVPQNQHFNVPLKAPPVISPLPVVIQEPKPDLFAKKQKIKHELQQNLIERTNTWWREHYSPKQYNTLCDNCVKQAANSSYILRKSTSDQSQKYTLHYKKDDVTYNVRLEITPEGTLSIPGQETTYASLVDLKKALDLRFPVNLQALYVFQNQTALEQHLLNWKQEFSDVSELKYIVQFALFRNEGPHFFLRKSENQADVFHLSYKKDQQIIEEKLTLQANGTLQIPSQRNKAFQNFIELSQVLHLGTSLTLEDLGEAKAFLIRHAPAPEEFLKEPQAVLDPQEEGEIEEAQGPRTLGMYSYLHGFKAFNSTTKQLTFQGKTYTPVTGGTTNISQKRLISCGSSTSREAIVLDPENSPILNGHFDKLLQQIQARQRYSVLNEEQIIDEVIRYVRQDIFPSCTDNHLENKVTQFVQDKWGSFHTLYYQQNERQGYIPAIPIDEFIKADIGVCRHHGLVTGYLLDRLTREPAQRPILQGVPQIIRDNIEGGAHVWTTFMSAKGNKWHIDTLWPVKKEFSQPEDVQRLQNKGYGIVAIRNQIQRTQWAHKLAIEGKEKKQSCKKALDRLILDISNISVNRVHVVLSNQPQDYVIREATSELHTYVLHYWDGIRFYQKRFTIQHDGAIRFSQEAETYQDLPDMIAKLNLKQCLTRTDIDSKLQALAAR